MVLASGVEVGGLMTWDWWEDDEEVVSEWETTKSTVGLINFVFGWHLVGGNSRIFNFCGFVSESSRKYILNTKGTTAIQILMLDIARCA